MSKRSKNKTGAQNNFDLSSLDLPVDISGLSEDGKATVTVILYSMKSMETRFLELIEQRDEKIQELEEKNKALEKKHKILEERLDLIEEKMDDTEAVSRKNNIIFSGPNLPVASQSEVYRTTVVNLLKNQFKVNLPPTEQIESRRIGRKPVSQAPDKRSILVRFSSEQWKNDVLHSCKDARVEGIYVNEDLSPNRKSILYVLRRAKKDFPQIVSGCSTSNGNVFAWLKPTSGSSEARSVRVSVNSFGKLSKFCAEKLQLSPSHYLTD